jgi:predicted 2-oxoglutarate/Fe(II)-dependent dioxygenase YbiX
MNKIDHYLTDAECRAIIESLDTVKDRHWAFVTGHDSNSTNRAKKVFAYKRYCGDILNRLNLDYTTAVEVLKYPPGTHSPVHVDGSGSHNDSSLVTRNVTWAKTRIVLLNDNFDGGELFFPNLGVSYSKECVGSLIEFPAGLVEYAHGVHPVRNGTRYTLVFRD